MALSRPWRRLKWSKEKAIVVMLMSSYPQLDRMPSTPLVLVQFPLENESVRGYCNQTIEMNSPAQHMAQAHCLHSLGQRPCLSFFNRFSPETAY